MKNRFLSLILSLAMVLSLIPTMALTASAATNGRTRDEAVAWILAQENTARDYDGAYGAQCVDLIYYYYNFLGQSSRGGNANYYMWNDLPAGWQRLSSAQATPQPGDIVVFDAGYYQTTIAWTTGWTGHVGLVYAADGSNYYYMDYNGWSPNNRQTNGQKRTAQIHDFSCVIRPDWPGAPAQSSEQLCDLGNFYGRIGYNGGWLHTTGAPIPDGAGQGMDVRVTTKSDLSDPSQVWQFIRQSNGSYKIVNMATKWCLDVQTGKVRDGGNVWVWSIDHGDTPERWMITQASGQTGFRLVFAIDNRYCMDIPGGDVHEGANAEIYTRNANSWQFFTITEISNYNPNQTPAKPEAVAVRTAPSASSITLGQSLATSRLSGGSVVNAGGTNVPGTWRWVSADAKPTATGKYDAAFTPTDTSKYMSTTLKVSVTVTDPCAKGHSYGNWKATLAATCSQAGQRTRTCTVCGAQDTQAIAALNHNWQPAGVGYSVCTNCGDTLNTGTLVPDGGDGFIVVPNDPALVPSTGNTASGSSGLDQFRKTSTYYSGLFKDVPASAWYADNVALAYELGLIRGRSAGQFAPSSNMTIAETITLAARMHSVYSYGEEAFEYYDGGAWYDPYVNYARAEGMVTENYDYSRPATRDEFVHILARALPENALAATKGPSGFADAQSIVHAGDVERLYRAGVIGGVDEHGLTWFMPSKTVTRAEAAAIVTRMVWPDMRL